jgi:hypothetical protein
MALTMVLSTRDGWDPRRRAGRCHNLLAPALVAHRDGVVHRERAAVLAEGGTTKVTHLHVTAHAASWCAPAPRNSLQSEVSPSTLSRRSMPSGCRSTRSTRSSTIRACSAGNSSFYSGSNSRRAPRTSLSARSLLVLRAARQVWTMTSGVLFQAAGRAALGRARSLSSNELFFRGRVSARAREKLDVIFGRFCVPSELGLAPVQPTLVGEHEIRDGCEGKGQLFEWNVDVYGTNG